MRGNEAFSAVEQMQQANRNEPERFVDAVVAARFLSIQRRQLLQLARAGTIPAYPIGEGQRRLWRFRLSDLSKAMEERMVQRKSTDSMGVKKPRSIR
jgi:excisionase family DNA binding protein